MSKIQIIKCGLCEKDIKTGFTDTENHTFHEIRLIHRDLAEEYYWKSLDTRAGTNLIRIIPICEECFKKINYGNVIKENEELKNENEELAKENYDLIREINELNGDMDNLLWKENQK